MVDIDLSKYKILLNQSYEKKLGKVAKVVGLTVEPIGPAAKLNDLCHIITQDKDQVINAEVVGFRDDRVLLMPYDQTVGVGLGSRVENTGAPLKVMVGDELLGKVLDGLGNPIDGSEIHCSCGYSVQAQPPDPLTRELIDTVLPLGHPRGLHCRAFQGHPGDFLLVFDHHQRSGRAGLYALRHRPRSGHRSD